MKRFICFTKECRVTLSVVVKSKLVTVLSLSLSRYKNDPWLWDLDWSTNAYRLKKSGSAASDAVDPFEREDSEPDPYPDKLKFEEVD